MGPFRKSLICQFFRTGEIRDILAKLVHKSDLLGYWEAIFDKLIRFYTNFLWISIQRSEFYKVPFCHFSIYCPLLCFEVFKAGFWKFYFRFVFFLTCGCVVSERAAKNISNNICPLCDKPYASDELIVLNQISKEKIQNQRDAMDERRARRHEGTIVNSYGLFCFFFFIRFLTLLMAQWVDMEALENKNHASLSCFFFTLWVKLDKSVVSNQPAVGWSRTDRRSVRDFSASKSTQWAIRRVRSS